MIEILGLIAGIFVMISFLCKNERSIRKVNLVSEILYLLYGFYINSISIFILNLMLIVIQVVALIRLEGK